MKPPMGEMMTGGGGVAGSYVHSGGHAITAMDSFIGDGGSKIVIRAVIENILYPINIDILHKVCSLYSLLCAHYYLVVYINCPLITLSLSLSLSLILCFMLHNYYFLLLQMRSFYA